MRDISIRRGVLAVLQDYRSATGADDATVTRIFSAGGGPPAVVGRDQQGRLIVPAVALHCLVTGTRAVLAVQTRWGKIVRQEDYEDTERVAAFDRYEAPTSA